MSWSRRLQVLGLLVAAYAVALVVIWARAVPNRQDQVIATMIATFVTAGALLTWFIVASGLSRRARVMGVVILIVVAAVLALQFRLDVTGDVRPLLRPRSDAAAVPEPETGSDMLQFVSTPGDAPQFLGPDRDGSYDVRLDPDWDAHPPEEMWRRSVGAGWSSFSAVGNVAFTQEQYGDREAILAYLVETGEIMWVHSYPARYETTIAGVGPRATPTVWGDTVWAMGATGRLTAVELFTGNERWAVNVIDDQGGRLQDWGRSSSPLIYEDLVIVTGGWGGPALIAYDRVTGEHRWSAEGGRPDYASPALESLDGREQILIFNADSVAGHDPATGEELWSIPWQTGQPTVAQPLVLGSWVLASSGYGRGAKLIDVRSNRRQVRASLVWESPRLKAKFAHFVHWEGYVYGLDDGVLTCIDPATGERVWKAGRYGHGQLILAEGLLLVVAEDGDLVLVEATPEEHRELHRRAVLDGKTWNVPTLVNDVLLVRNDREAVALRLPLREPPGSEPDER